MEKPPLRIALIGCVASSEAALRALLSLQAKDAEVVGLITRSKSSYNSDFVNIAPIAEGKGVPVLFADQVDKTNQAKWLAACSPDLVFVVGWSQLLGNDTLAVPALGTIGYHPAALPGNRGRHPLVWALVLGLSETASSFFLMGEGTDDGPLVSQHPVAIAADDTAQTLYEKILSLIPRQIVEIVSAFNSGTVKAIPQDERQASYWRKRTEADGRIDWRMSADSIYNLVRALARPYPGAEIVVGDRAVKVWSCAIEPLAPANAEPGKVLAVSARTVVVKAGDKAVRLLDHELPDLPAAGDYL